MIDLGDGVVLCASAERGRFSQGSKVDVFVRPEDITLGMPMAGQSNVLPGTVPAHSYQGSFTHVVVALPSCQPVILAIPGGDVVERHAPGSPVHVRLGLSPASILPG